MTYNEKQLRAVCQRISDAVCSVHGVVSREDTEAKDRFERLVGKTYDAINGCWRPLPAPEPRWPRFGEDWR